MYRKLSRVVFVLTLMVCVARPAVSAALDVGQVAPAVSGIDLQNRAVSLATLRGRVVMVDFWATWCAPCAAEMPVLQSLYDANRAGGLTIVGVSVDRERPAIAEFVQRNHISFPIVHDASHQIAQAFGPRRMPTSYLIDRRGRVRFVHTGFRTADTATITQEIRALLAEAS